MAELILTDEEKAAASYLDWDDAALGKFAKRLALSIQNLPDDEDGFHRVTATSCAMLLVGTAYECNAGKLTVTLEGHTHAGVETGDWTITVERKGSKPKAKTRKRLGTKPESPVPEGNAP